MIVPHSKIGHHFPVSYYFLYLLPKNTFSRLCGIIAAWRLPGFFLVPMIRLFIRAFHVDMSEAVEPVTAYPTFNAFFTRRLKPETRPIHAQSNGLISPIDGTIGQFGLIVQGNMMQAKGLHYTLADLLDDPVRARAYENGNYITFYLAPHNYHRIHSPVSGTIKHCTYLPGQLWTVSPLGVNNVRNLFPRNERIVSYLETIRGECAVIKIGATVVGKVKLSFHSLQTNGWRAKRTEVTLYHPYPLKKGDELGWFELGSTVICCFKPGQVHWHPFAMGQAVRWGEAIGTFYEEEGKS